MSPCGISSDPLTTHFKTICPLHGGDLDWAEGSGFGQGLSGRDWGLPQRKDAGSCVRQPGFKSWLCCVLPVCLWANL